MPDFLVVNESQRNEAGAARAHSATSTHPLRGRKVLFVDDDRDLRAIFRRCFRYTGADIHLAEGPIEAISMAGKTDYCVVVTDLQMPEMNGLEMIERLWSEQLLTSFILVTGAMNLNLPTNSPSARAISSMVRKPWLPEHIDVALVQAVELYDRRVKEAKRRTQVIRILLVEDEGAEQKLSQDLLRGGDHIRFEWERVSRLDMGIAAARDHNHDIIISDLSLPDARGLDTVAGLRRSAPGLPIIMLSGSHDEDLAIQAVSAGAQDYLAKDEVTGKSLLRTIRNALERKSNEEHLSYLTLHDQLTGLPNRELFLRRANEMISNARARSLKPAIVILDLDKFRTTNDILGHSVGDLLLVQVAKRLLDCLENKDGLARLGGDEFAVLVDQDSGQEVSKITSAMLSALQKDFCIGGHSITTAGSAGISVFPDNGTDAEQLLANADAAMYRAKEAGRNCYQFFDERMHQKAVEWMELERELKGALARNEFQLHYQPQVDCKSNEVLCFEALLRWTHPKLGHVGPFRFIPVLEADGSINEVGAWVLQEACRQLSEWRKTRPTLRIAVNVSAIQFEDDGLAEIVTSALHDAGLPADALELEITEGLLMKDFDHTMSTLEKLSSLGVRIAIDDFGTGYSNLSYMARYPIDVLKIDKSITDMIGTHNGDSINVAVVQLGKALGIEILSEGVETLEQLRFLQKIDVEVYQGYFFAKPLDVQSATEEIQKTSDCPEASLAVV